MPTNNAGLMEDTIGDPQVAVLKVGKDGKALSLVDHELGEVLAVDADGVVSAPVGGVAATKLATSGASVGVSAAAPPSTGQALIATAATTATWQTLPDASKLKTSGASVDVVSAAPPSAGQVLVATDATHATWKSVLVGGSQPLWLPPATAHADDVEFEATGIPSGFILRDVTGASTITPSGAPDPYSAPAGGAARFAAHTGWRNSWGALQLSPTGTHDHIFAKPITAVTNMFVWCRLGMATINGDAVSNYISLALFADASGLPDLNNYVSIGWLRGTGVRTLKVTSGATVSAGTQSNIDPFGLEYFGIQQVGTNYYGHAWSDGGNHIVWPVLAHTPTKAWLGFVCRAESTTPGSPIYRFDFIRRVDSAQGLPT
jgi:hypothetical protein